jgi:hypothetical protein
MSESVVGDFRNFCLESCCESKYNLRVRPNYTQLTDKICSWWLEGVITADTKKLYIVVKEQLKINIGCDQSVVDYYERTYTKRASIKELKELIAYWEKLPK